MKQAIFLVLLGILSIPSIAATSVTTQYTMEYPPGSGITRYYAVSVPPNLAASPAMVIVLHGTTYGPSNKPVTYKDLGWIAESALPGHGNIVVTPSATWDPHWQYYVWNAQFFDKAVFYGKGPYPDDIGFLRQLIVNVTVQFHVDPLKVFAVGHSSGGYMVHRVARDLSDLVAAVAVSSATLEFQSGSIPVPPVVHPVSILEFHGTADTQITPCDRMINWNNVNYPKASVDDTFNYWTSQNSCQAFATTAPLCSGFTNNDATFCNGGAEIKFVWEPGVGHLYLATNNPTIWNFFVAHSTPASLAPASLAFGSVVIGVPSAAQTATFQNNLSTPLGVSSISASGDYSVLSNTCGTQVPALGSCQIVVTLTPKATGSRTGTLVVTDSATPSQLSLTLTGTGVAVKAVSLAVVPSNPTIPKTTIQQFRALEGFNNGVMKDVTSTVAWSSSVPVIASVGSTGKGLVTGLAVGSTAITAKLTTPAFTTSTTLTVGPAPLTSITVTPGTAVVAAGLGQQFSALGKYADGSTQDVSAMVTWSSSNVAAATVSATGLVTTIASGGTTITASIGAVSGSAALTVNPATLTSIAVSPGAAAVAAGLAQQFSATGTYTNGSTQDVSAQAIWSSSNLAAASVGPTGLATTITTGVTNIRANVGAFSANSSLTVTPAALASITIAPATSTIGVGSNRQYTATGIYTNGATKNLTGGVTWATDNPATSVIDSFGLGTVVGTGTSNILATATTTSGAISGSATLTGTTDPVACDARIQDMKVLVVTSGKTESDFPAITQALDYFGTPYTVFDTTAPGAQITPQFMANGCHGLYQGVIYALGDYRYGTVNGVTGQANVDSYEQAFQVRQLNWNFNFSNGPDFGLTPVTTIAASTTPTPATYTTAGQSVFQYANTANPLNIVNAKITTAAADATATPLLLDASGNALASVFTPAYAYQQLTLSFDSNPNLTHDLVLAHGLVDWVTSGMFLGERHTFLTPQVDDFFQDGPEWTNVLLCSADPNNTGTRLRIGGVNDLQPLLSWQAAQQANPITANFVLHLAFNGNGTTGVFNPDDLTALAQTNQSSFKWISHAFDNLSLDNVDTPTATNEITQNNASATTLGLANYSAASMVTPGLSGLGNPNFLQAAVNSGVTQVVSNASLTGYGNPSPNTGVINSQQSSILMIPRRSTDLFFNVATPSDWTAEYACAYPAANYNYSQIVDSVSNTLVANMLRGDLDPVGFHQANLFAYTGRQSLFSDLMDATLLKYSGLVTLPLLSPRQDAIAAKMVTRAQLNAAGVTASFIPHQRVMITAQQVAVVPVTGLATPAAEGYGGQPISHVPVAAGQTVTLPLP